MHVWAGQAVDFSSSFHFWAVGFSALVATVAGFALAFAGKRRHDAGPALVGTAFTVMAALLVVHGIATPYFIVGENGVSSLTGQAVLMVGVIALVVPSLVPDVPEPSSPAALALLVAGFAFYGLVALRVLRTVILARRAADLLVLVGIHCSPPRSCRR